MFKKYLQHAFVRNAISLYGIQVAGYILPLLTFPYLARVLGKEKFGLIAWSQAFVGYFLTITEYGFNFSVVREVSLSRNDPAKLNRIYTSAMAARFLLMAGCFVVMAIIIPLVPKFQAEWRLFYIGFLAVVGMALFPQWLFQGIERMGYITIREVGARFFGLLVVFVLVRTSDDYPVGCGDYVRQHGFGRPDWTALRGKADRRQIHPRHVGGSLQVLREGWHVFLSTASITVYTKSNVVILGLIGTVSEIGVFAAALRLIDATKVLVFPMSGSIYPHVSRLAGESRPRQLPSSERA